MNLTNKISISIRNLWQSAQQAIQNKKIRQIIYGSIVLISVAFIAYAIINNWSELKSQSWHINPVYVIIAVLFYPLGMLPTAAAWHSLLKAFGIRQPFSTNLRIYAISSLPKHIPGFIWYVTSRTLMYEEIGVSASKVLGATAVEAVLMPLSGFISAIFISSILFDVSTKFVIFKFLIPIAMISLLLLIVWAPGGTRVLDRLIQRIGKLDQPIQFQRSKLIVSLCWMFIAWAGGGILLWILVRGITFIGWELLPTMIGIWGAAGAVSLSLGIGIQGLGLREVTLGAILSKIMPTLIAIVIAVTFRLVLTLGEFLWVFLISVIIKKPKN
jgi:hypothetical protein